MITTTSPHPSRTTLRRRLWLAGCARRVLVEHGYAGLTAERVAWAAGTDGAAVRWTYSDRPALAVAALTEGLPRFDAGPDGSPSLPALERWRAAVGHRVAPLVGPLEALVDSAGVESAVLDEVHRRLVGPTRRALDAIVDDGSTPTERDLLCAATWATAVIEAACHHHVGDVPGLRHVVTFVMRPVPAAPAAALVA
jgi:AcrR family transcriptional regulator